MPAKRWLGGCQDGVFKTKPLQSTSPDSKFPPNRNGIGTSEEAKAAPLHISLNLLTIFVPCVIVSSLIQRGGGIGPMKPRQPQRVPIPADDFVLEDEAHYKNKTPP